MKVTLERADLIAILKEHFGSDFRSEDIVIRADPFEVEVRNVSMPASEKHAAPAPSTRASVDPETAYAAVPNASSEDAELVLRRADADATVDPPPPGNDELGTTSVAGSPLSIIQQSRELEMQLERERNSGTAPQRRGGSTKAPTNFQDEV